MAEKIKYNTDKNPDELLLESKKMDLESGWLGKFFGSPTHSPVNIAGLLIILLVLTGIVTSFVLGSMSPKDYWTTMTPLITLALGYVFGKQS